MIIEIKALTDTAIRPKYQSKGAAAVDLHVDGLLTDSGRAAPMMITRGANYPIHTGLAIHIRNPDYVGIIVPRSGLGTKGIVLRNTVGVIDSDYQGEIIVNLHNVGNDVHYISQGDRIAQLLFVPIARAEFVVHSEFTHESERGAGGFGSTGK